MRTGPPKKRRWLLLCTALVGVVFLLLSSKHTQAAAGINQQINFQGRLLNSQGATVPDGFYNIEFKIYQDGDGQSVGDTTGSPAGSLKWTEDYLNNNSQGVTVKNGYFSVQLGSITPFGTNIDWNQDTLWLSLNIGGTGASCTPFSACSPDGEMIPMKRLASSPYALNSHLLGGLDSSQFVQLAQGLQTDASTATTIDINKTGGSGNFIGLQAGGTDVFTLTNSGDITFGANADHTLSVATAGSGVAGKALTISGGAAGSGASALSGGNLVLQGGAGGGTNGNGGNVVIDAGAKNGVGSDGTISIGTNHASAINIGNGILSVDTSANLASLGSASSLTGKLAFYNSGGAHTITLQGPAANPGANYSLTIPTLTANDTICVATLANCGSAGAVTAVGTIDSQTKSADGAVISSDTIYLQTADASFPGLVSTGSQTFAGGKTFSGLLTGQAGLTVAGAAVSLNASSNFNTSINTGTSTGTVSIGNGSAGAISLQSGSTIGLTAGTSLSLASTGANAININPGGTTNTGVVVKPGVDSTAAFQAQNSSGNSVLAVDTTNNQIRLGQSNAVNGSLLFQNSSDSNSVTLNSTGTNASYTLTLPSSAPATGLCLETSGSDASQLTFASCTNNNASIQEVHEWDANNTNTMTIAPATAGDEIVLTTQIPTGGISVSSISGGGVTNWTKATVSAGNGTVNRVEMWVGTVTTTGSSTVTVNYSGSPGAEEVTATEFTAAGVTSSTSWGIESTSSQLNSTSSSTVTYPSMTAVNGSELYVGYAQVQNPPATAGSTSNFNYIVTSTQHNAITYDTSLAANTAYQPTANQNSAGQSNTVAAVLTAFVTSSSINNTTSLQKANFYVQAANAGSVAGVLQAASSGTADILQAKDGSSVNVVSVGHSGATIFQNSTDSSSAFSVQNQSGQNILGVNTTTGKTVLGASGALAGALSFSDINDSNTITLTAPSSVAASYTLSLPTNTPTAGLCLGTSPSNANQLIFASCATQVSAASISYVNQWSNSGAGVTTISDSPSNVGDLLVFYSHSTNNVSISGLSGGGVTNWTKVTSNTGITGGNVEMWRGVVTSTGAGTITATYSSGAGTNDITAQEFSMGSTGGTWAVDTSGTTNGSSATINYPSLTPASSSELYAGYAWGANTMSAGSTSGYTYTATSLSKYTTRDTNVTGGSPQQPTASQNTSGNYNSVAALIAAYAGTSVIVNSTATQQANFDVQAATAGTVAAVLQAASSGSADILQAKDGSGNNILAVNASSGVTLGTSNAVAGTLNFAASGNSNVITIDAPSAPGSSYTLSLPTTTPAAGQCLASSPSNANQLVFSSCANQVTSIAISYDNSWKTSGNNVTTLTVAPDHIGDLMTFFSNPHNAVSISSISGGGVTTWSKVTATTSGSGSDTSSIEMWRGVVTSTGSSTITVTFSGPAGNANELAAMEFTTGSTTGSWVVDSSNTQYNGTSSTTVTFPSLTPQSSKDLYVGYGTGTSATSSGGSSGFTYLSGSLASRIGLYNNNVSTTTQPTATQTTAGASLTIGALIAAYSSSSVISNSTVTQEANMNVQAATSGSVAATLQAASSGSGDVLDILDGSGTLVDKFSSTGNLLIQPSTASASAFAVQTTGSANVLSVDTSGKKVVIGAGSTGESSPSLLVLDNETGTTADPTETNGAMYYNATTHNFRCGVDGTWANCDSLLYANTSQSSAVSNCTTNCAAFSTASSIPANYCQPGRFIDLKAAGYYSSQATASNLQFGVYYGTDGTNAANDTLLGSLSPTESVSSASNNYFQMNFHIICFSTSSMQTDGTLSLQTGSSGAGMLVLPMSATGGTTVVSSTAKNLYIFPVWGTASTSNTATLAQFTVNGY